MAFKYNAGLGAVGSYQVSGKPWITGSNNGLASGEEDTITFPTVAKAVTIINTDTQNADLHVHFNSKSSGNVSGGLHYIALTDRRDSITLACKCTKIYLSCPSWGGGPASYSVLAELTGIADTEMLILTGSGLTD